MWAALDSREHGASLGGSRRRGGMPRLASIESMAGTIVVTMKGHWLSAWWLRLTARPFIRIDGVEQAVRWGVPCSTRVTAGEHAVAGGIRYPGFAMLMGVNEATVTVGEDQTVALIARNGPLNGEPFTFTPVR